LANRPAFLALLTEAGYHAAAALIGRPGATGETGVVRMPVIIYAYIFDNADVAVDEEGRVGLLTAWLRRPSEFETTFAMEVFVDVS